LRKKDIVWIGFLILIGMLAGWYLIQNLSGRKEITLAGSVAMETFAEALTEQTKAVDLNLKPEFIGSSAGIEALLKGNAEIALVSRYLTEEEKTKGIVENVIANDGIVIIVNGENPITNLSRKQLADIYTGKIDNWKELGGIDEPIVVIGREYGSGTRDSFEKLLEIKGKSQCANECDSIGVVKTKVELLEGAIGYVSLESVQRNEGVKIVAIDHVLPDRRALEQGQYLLTRPFILATLGEIERQDTKVQKIFALLATRQGEIIFEKAGVAATTKRKS